MTEISRQRPVDSAVAAGARGQPVDGLALTRPSLRADARPQPDHRRLGQLSGLRLRLQPTTCPQPLGQPSTSFQVAHTDQRPGDDEFFFFFFSLGQRPGEGGRPAHRYLDRLGAGCTHDPQPRRLPKGPRASDPITWSWLGPQAPRGSPQNRGPPTSSTEAVKMF